MSGDDFRNIRLAVAQWTLLWQPVEYGRGSQILRGTTFTSRRMHHRAAA